LAPTTHTFLEATTKTGQKRPEMQSRGDDFKADSGRARPHPACGVQPEVKLHDRDRRHPPRPPRRRLLRRADADEPWSTLTRLDPIYYLVDVTRSVITGFSESAVGASLAVAALAAVATSRCVAGWVGNVDDEPTLA
jgi:hypothetical protein